MKTATAVTTLLLCGATSLAGAQSSITLFGGARSGNGFEQGSASAPIDMRSSGAASLAVGWPYDSSRTLQLFLSHQRTRLNLGAAATPGELPLQVSYLHLGGVNFFDSPVGRGPYLAGGLGLTVFDPRLQGTSSRVRASLSAGIGYEWPLARALSLRAELRGYATLVNSNGSFFCSGGCVVSIKGDTLTQVEAMAGLTFGF